MFGRRPLEVLVLLVCAAKGACTDGGRQASPSQELSQSEAEIVLGAQSALRRYFIESLENLLDDVLGLHPFDSVVGGILEGLRSRDLDPLKAFGHGYNPDNNQSATYQMAAVIHSMQGCSPAQTTLDEWYSFLQTIPPHRISDIAPPKPAINHLTPQHLRKANAATSPYVILVLLQIQHNHLKLTKRLLGDVLYNYPFQNHSPDLDTALHNILHMIATTQAPLDAFRPNPAPAQPPDQILADIFKFVLRRQRSHSRLAFESAQLLSALSNADSVQHLRGASTPWGLFELITPDDYPPDVVGAAAQVAAAIRNEEVEVDAESFKGYSPLPKLLKVISQLAALPVGNALSPKIHAIYPHVKLRYLSTTGRFFHPRTSSDVAFLLNSFLTLPAPLLIADIHNIFLLPHFNWRTLLQGFNYSKYTKPRPLLMAMLEHLLRNSHKLPACDLLLFSYFLTNYTQVPPCSPYKFNHRVPSEKLEGLATPLSLLPDIREISRPTGPPHTPQPETTPHQCSNGPPIQMVDPESILEIFYQNHRNAFISDLIRSHPMPLDRYPHETRAAVYKTLINDLHTNNHNSTTFLMHQALLRMPLNQRANLPPRYFRLCPPTTTPLPPCDLIPVIDRDSILHIVARDPNFHKIKRHFSSLTIPYQDYKNFPTRDLVLRAFLANRKKASNSSDQQEITQIIHNLLVSQDGLLQPVVRHQCPQPPPPTIDPLTPLLSTPQHPPPSAFTSPAPSQPPAASTTTPLPPPSTPVTSPPASSRHPENPPLPPPGTNTSSPAPTTFPPPITTIPPLTALPSSPRASTTNPSSPPPPSSSPKLQTPPPSLPPPNTAPRSANPNPPQPSPSLNSTLSEATPQTPSQDPDTSAPTNDQTPTSTHLLSSDSETVLPTARAGTTANDRQTQDVFWVIGEDDLDGD